MPKTSLDYKKAAIYRIVCRDVTLKETYVGSTTNFEKRKAGIGINLYRSMVKTRTLKFINTLESMAVGITLTWCLLNF